MKKTEFKYLIRSIRKNMVSFFAVAFIAAISISIYLGLQAGATATLMAGDAYFTENRLHSLEIRSAVGITDEDLEMLAGRDDVDAAEGGYVMNVSLDTEDEIVPVTAMTMPDNINIPVVMEGALPTEEDEVAIEERFAVRRGIRVGDEIRLMHDGGLLAEEFRVTAIVNTPAYCCLNMAETRGIAGIGLGASEYYVLLPEAAVNTAFYYGRYTIAYVRNEELDALNDYSEEYLPAEKEFAEIIGDLDENWTVTARSNTGDLRGFSVLVDSIYGLSYVLSIIFVLVAVVVCHAAISRMIFEQRPFIGVQKALGFTTGEVLKHYTFYNMACAVLGIIIGYVIALTIVENVVVTIFGQEFSLQKIPMIFPFREAGIAAVVSIVIFLFTTWLGCASLSRQQAIELLRDEVPSQGKGFFFQKWSVYRRLNLYSRTMIKNVLNDKSRMMSTIVGVVGCISLLVICVALKMSIENSSVTQFDRYFLYENRLVINEKAGDADTFRMALEEADVSYVNIHDKLKTFRADGNRWEAGHIVAADSPELLEGFMVLEDIETKKIVPIPDDGVLVSRKTAETYGLSEGSSVEFLNSAGQQKTFRIAGVIEHYLSYPLFVTTTAHYESVMEESADSCVYLLKGNIDGLHEKVRTMDGFLSLKDNSAWAANASQVDMVIGLCLALAAIMSLLVLLNQIVLHIKRKAKELAVMRINGYTLKETRAYVYKDNIVLTVIGLILGCGAGSGLAYLAIRIMEGEVNHYVRSLNPTACLFGVVVGSLFAFLVNVLALRRIKTLNLTNVNSN